MQLTFSSRLLTGLTAAAGALGAAAMMSTAAAPTARADDFTDVVNAIEGDFTAGQADFTAAFTDFGSNNVGSGLAELFSGVDDDSVGAPNNLALGSAELLANDSVTGPLVVTIPAETTFAGGLSEAESFFADSQTYANDILTFLSSGNYVDATLYDYYSSVYDAAAFQVLFEGLVASL